MLTALAGLCLCFRSPADFVRQQNPAQTPDMQKLIQQIKDQAKQGIPPTADQMAQLQKLQQGYQQHFGTAGNASIPCTVTVTMSYTATKPDDPSGSPKGYRESGSLTGTAPAVMTATVNGNADYLKNPSGSGASMFTIGSNSASGFGNLTVTRRTSYESVDPKGKSASVSYSYSGSSVRAGAGIALIRAIIYLTQQNGV